MAKYDRKQIEALAKSAGFNDLQAWLWSFIALAESEGDPSVVNKNTDGSFDTGLWQINSIHQKANPSWTKEWLLNPANNARAAYALAKDSGKGSPKGTQPWEASRKSRGDYKGWQDRAKEWQSKNVVGGFVGEGNTGEYDVDSSDLPIIGPAIGAAEKAGDAVEGVAGALGDVGAAAWKAGGWLGNPRNWLRVAYVAGGLALVVSGAALIARPAIEGATNVLPVGKIAKMAKGAKA